MDGITFEGTWFQIAHFSTYTEKEFIAEMLPNPGVFRHADEKKKKLLLKRAFELIRSSAPEPVQDNL